MSKQNRPSRWQQFVRGSRLWIFAIIMTLSLTLIFSFNLDVGDEVVAEVGQPVLNDVLAPQTVTYTSDVLTERARDQISQNVQDVYTVIDSEIGRGQLNLAQLIFSFVDVVRTDSQATPETKLTYLHGIEALTFEEEIGESVLGLNQSEYDQVKSEINRIVGEIMREDIRESQVSDYRRRASRDVRLDLTPTQTQIVTSLAPQFIVPTVFFDADGTEARRQESIENVEPQIRTIFQGQRVLRSGDIVREEDVEALQELGLLETTQDWRDVASVFMLSLISVVLLTMHWQQFHRKHWAENGRYLAAMFYIFFVFSLLGRVLLSGSTVLAYWFPIAAMSMMFTVIYDARFSILATILMAVFYGFIVPNSFELMLYVLVGGVLATLTLRDLQRINAYFRAGVIAALGHIIVILIFQFSQDVVDIIPVLQLMLYGLANGILSAALTLVWFLSDGGACLA